jgi:NADH-quinone oxidoreductase subunit M
MGGIWLFFALAALGLPGMGNFVGEFLVLLGAYRVSVPMTVLAALGLVVSTIYAVWMVQKIFFGMNVQVWRIPDLSARETATLAAMMAVILWIGLYPQPCLDTARGSLEGLREKAHLTLKEQTAQIGLAGGAHERP